MLAESVALKAVDEVVSEAPVVRADLRLSTAVTRPREAIRFPL